MKKQTYMCGHCGSEKTIEVEDKCIVRYTKCNNESCERSILGVAGGMILKNG